MKEKTIFDPSVDYEKPSNNRTMKFTLEDGNIVYLNQEEFYYMTNFYWREKSDAYRENRCLVSSKYKGLKRCIEDCSTCSHYMNGKTNGPAISIDALYKEYEWESMSEETGPREELMKQEKIEKIRNAVNSIPDSINRKIVILFMYENLSDVEIAKSLSMARKTVNDRRRKSFSQLAKELEDYKLD